jgi:ribosomal protein L14
VPPQLHHCSQVSSEGRSSCSIVIAHLGEGYVICVQDASNVSGIERGRICDVVIIRNYFMRRHRDSVPLLYFLINDSGEGPAGKQVLFLDIFRTPSSLPRCQD